MKISGAREEFVLRIAPNQPLDWEVGAGRSVFPDANRGSLVPAQDEPFEAVLRCIAREDDQRPSDRNALIGTARVEIDGEVGAYSAVGLAAVEGAVDDDDVLTLGGPRPEYAACPAKVALTHFFDGAERDAVDEEGSTRTLLALAPCTMSRTGVRATAQNIVFNEFGQRFSTSFPLIGGEAGQLSRLDTRDPQRSIFSVAVQTTQTGRSEIRAFDGERQIGLVGVALQRSVAADATYISLAGVNAGFEGLQAAPDRLVARRPACPGDCDGNLFVTVDELIVGVNSMLGSFPGRVCRAMDRDASNEITIDELLAGIAMLLDGCTVSAPGAGPSGRGSADPW